MATAANSATQVKIIVIGGKDSGKSSLVDKLRRGRNRAPVVNEEKVRTIQKGRVGRTTDKLLRRKQADGHTKKTKILQNECVIENESVIIYDSQVGIDDPEVVSVAKTCNVILVCQNLYELEYNELLAFRKKLGPEGLQRAIIVFTFGDEYNTLFSDYQGSDKQEAAKKHLLEKKKGVMENIKSFLKSKGIEEEFDNDMPSMITSAVEDSLPTTIVVGKESSTALDGGSWVNELWDLCKERHAAAIPKENAKILIIGHTQIGKSSFINKIVGKKVAEVGTGLKPCTQGFTVPIDCTIKGVSVKIYDSRGLSDPTMKDRAIIDKMISDIRTVDIVLICHKLYDSFDASAKNMLNESARVLGNDLMEHAIFVFTYGDGYTMQDDCENKDKAKEHMIQREEDIKQLLKDELKSHSNIEKEIVDGIPSIITCGKCDSLPTSDNWVEEFWSLCEERCSPEALPFVSWIRRNMKETVAASTGVGIAVAGGLIAGAVGGALVGTGTIPIPGVGTVAGAVVGAVGGAIVGGAIAGGGGAAVAKGSVQLMDDN